ncbi:M20 family metallopeptidase [Novipirellula sp.]|uniref:M20 metallopeptidase family protein n=1 Tax=Novipirellula sp. TaxID=2795430 RepID=UPI003561A9B5
MTDSQTWLPQLNEVAKPLHADWVSMRRYLHQNPELSDSEYRTTEYLTCAFTKLGLPTHIPIDKRGLTADLVTFKHDPNRWIAIRGDIDALPISDAKAVDYRSTCEGVMHACGHDVHATVVVAAMQILTAMHKADRLPWPIAARAILQPSEELATGARYMIHHHALRDIDAILALHVDPTRSVGCIGLRHGTLTAACDAIHVTITGNGGHGARPHLTNDPIDAITHWVQSAFRRLGRTVNAHQTVVFSVGELHAGHSTNVIPDSAALSGSLRSLDAHSRRIALETLEDVCRATEIENNCKVKMELGFSAPAVINDDSLVDLLTDTATAAFTAGAIEWIDEPSMGSEDFSYYLKQIPGAMFRLGVAGDQVGHAPLHTPAFDIDEQAIMVGAKLFAASVIAYFDPNRTPIPTENA